MGDSGLTCAVSGLPIHIGQKLIAFWITKSPSYHSKGQIIYAYGDWFLRTIPMRATLDEYGRLRDFDPLTAKAWTDQFAKDLIPVSAGLSGDPEISASMAWEQYEEAVRDGRLRVRGRDYDPAKDRYSDDVLSGLGVGTPTVAKVKEALHGAGFTKFTVSELVPFLIVIHGDVDVTAGQLSKALPSLSNWESALSLIGLNSKPCIFVVPKTGKTSRHRDGYYPGVEFIDEPKADAELSVALTVVREDVWKGVVKNGTGLYDKKDKAALSKCLTEYNKNLKKPIPVELINAGLAERMAYGERYSFGQEIWKWLPQLPSLNSVTDCMVAFMRKHDATPLFPLWKEMCVVNKWMSLSNNRWRPATICLSHDDFLATRVSIYEMFARLAKRTKYK